MDQHVHLHFHISTSLSTTSTIFCAAPLACERQLHSVLNNSDEMLVQSLLVSRSTSLSLDFRFRCLHLPARGGVLCALTSLRMSSTGWSVTLSCNLTSAFALQQVA
eukprot:5078929-Amphidinium_carterae.1